MKTKTSSIFYAAFILASVLLFGECKQEHTCPSPNAKVYLQYSNQFVPYQGNEQLKFLHNNTDTQIFIGQGKTSYFINDNTASDMGCSKDHESTKINFINNTSKDTFLFKYEFDNALFPSSSSWNNYTFYKFSYKGKIFDLQFTKSDTTNITLNNKKYYGYFIGTDSSNYVGYNLTDRIFRIRINNETWDLIP